MRSSFNKFDHVLIALSVLGLGCFFFLFPKLYPEHNIQLSQSKVQIIQQGHAFVEALGYEIDEIQPVVILEHDSQQLQYLNRAFSVQDANTWMREDIPVYYWKLKWYFRQDSTQEIRIDFSGNPQDSPPDELASSEGFLQLRMDLKGRPIALENQSVMPTPVDSSALASMDDQMAARQLTDRLFTLYDGYWSYLGKTEREFGSQAGQIFRWRLDDRLADERVGLRVQTALGRVHSFEINYSIPKPWSELKESPDWMNAGAVIVFLFVFIMGIIYFVQRLRADLMDLRAAWLPSVLAVVSWAIIYYTQTLLVARQVSWEIWLGLLITSPFVAGGMWALFALGESMTREVWHEKLLSMDVLRTQLVSHASGLALLRGVLIAYVMIGFYSVAQFVGLNFSGGYFDMGDSPLHFWMTGWSSLFIIAKSLISALFIIMTFCLFIASIIKRRLKTTWLLFPLAALFWAIVSFPLPQMEPAGLRLVINALTGLLVILFFIKYDFLSVAMAAFLAPLLFYGRAAFSSGSLGVLVQGVILFAVLLGVGVVGWVGSRKEETPPEIVPFVPDYLKRIYEKERIQRELEIARNVQLQFLPRINPSIKGLDVSSLCIPAREVGGDYFDFIEIDDRKLGVAIGDVSGKGISAAFYMTLTKGFLRSQAKNIHSPREILINMNELFYENVERGVFISMIYGVFDLDSQSLTFARAGHNPMIVRRSGQGEADELSPPGIALGLEKGVLFSKTLEERTVGIGTDDLFLFYTDGLNEAQNLLQHEFGEERLRKLVEDFSCESVESVLKRIQFEIQQFTEKAPQHDDMTAVAVKVI